VASFLPTAETSGRNSPNIGNSTTNSVAKVVARYEKKNIQKLWYGNLALNVSRKVAWVQNIVSDSSSEVHLNTFITIGDESRFIM
jgi:hypothetical protein